MSNKLKLICCRHLIIAEELDIDPNVISTLPLDISCQNHYQWPIFPSKSAVSDHSSITTIETVELMTNKCK